MSKSIQMRPGASANGDVGQGLLTGGNTYTVSDPLAAELVNRGLATYVAAIPNTTPQAAVISGPQVAAGAVSVIASDAAGNALKPDGSPFSGGTGISTLSSATDYNANLVAPLAAKLPVPTSWAASPTGGAPALSSGTAVLGASYRNTTPGLTTFNTAIDGIPSVQQDDCLFCFVAGTYALVPAGSVGPAATAFATAWDMTSASGKDMGETTVTGALALTSVDTASVPGGFSDGVLIADGAHVPTFDGATLPAYTNTAGARNRATLKRIGKTKFWSVSSIVGAIMAIAAAPTIAVAPQILVANNGSVITFLPAQGVTGYPAPTLTYDAYVGASLGAATLLQANITNGTYTMTGQAGNLYLKANAANASGTITVASSGAAIQTITDTPELSEFGDSITGYGQFNTSAVGATITRDTNGLVTIVHTSLAPTADGQCILINMVPASLTQMGMGHRVDINTYTIQTTVTGAVLASTDCTAITGLTPCILQMDQVSNRGFFHHLQNSAKGGIKYKGNFGMQGATAEQMLDVAAKATLAVSPGHYVKYMGVINSIKNPGS